MLSPAVYNTSEICHALGIEHVVLSPGSRNAPLSISFARNDKVEKWIVPDERSAGFIALGIAQHTETPVVLSCTSGTALLNYAPAIAEAFYREIPLIVLSADRPPALVDQRDGQTIRQFEVLKNHVKGSFQLTSESAYQEELISAIQSAQGLPKGPIHVNLPFAEPFYPSEGQVLQFSPVTIPRVSPKPDPGSLPKLASYEKIMVLVGQQPPSHQLDQELEEITDKVPVIKSPLNNLSVKGIEHIDSFISDRKDLQPDLLVTSGLSVLSKNLKIFLRKYKPKQHIHLDPAGVEVDTFETSPTLLEMNLSDFIQHIDYKSINSSYLTTFKESESAVKNVFAGFFQSAVFSEVSTAYQLLHSLPGNSELHLGNSMPVRYADLFGIKERTTVWSNRGTSGIDGCTSTALGSSLVSDRMHVLLTGDLSFLYDRNAFFHNYKAPNLRVIVLNNQGGGIFRLIDGPSQLPELEAYFETRHDRSAKYICEENGFTYLAVSDGNELTKQLASFYEESDETKVMEVFTDPITNQTEYKKLKQHIHEQLKD